MFDDPMRAARTDEARAQLRQVGDRLRQVHPVPLGQTPADLQSLLKRLAE